MNRQQRALARNRTPNPAPATRQVSGLLLVSEALDKCAAARVRDEIIERSLHGTEFDAIPDHTQDIARYVGGPLFDAVDRRLGTESAMCVVEDLGHVIRRAKTSGGVSSASGVHRRPSHNKAAEWIVIVDQDPHVRDSLTRALRSKGYAVVAAADGHMALLACRRRPPALVISEVQLPALDGPHLAWLLALRFGSSSPPVILWSGHANVREPADNVVCVLAKPQLRKMLDTVDQLLNRRATRA